MNCKALLTCEKVIIDKDGAHSLINVMLNASIKLQEAQGQAPPRDVDIPSNAVAPNQWWIYTLWEPAMEDVGQSFVQVYEVYWPNGDKLAPPEHKLQLPFIQRDDKMNQTTFYIAGFPVGQQGKVRIVTWLESQAGDRRTNEIENFVRIEHLTGKPAPNTTPVYSANFSHPQ